MGNLTRSTMSLGAPVPFSDAQAQSTAFPWGPCLTRMFRRDEHEVPSCLPWSDTRNSRIQVTFSTKTHIRKAIRGVQRSQSLVVGNFTRFTVPPGAPVPSADAQAQSVAFPWGPCLPGMFRRDIWTLSTILPTLNRYHEFKLPFQRKLIFLKQLGGSKGVNR